MPDGERQLIKQALTGDNRAFGELVTRSYPQVMGLILRMGIARQDALDIAQEAFLQVYRSLGTFQQEAKFSTWVYRIAANKCLDFLRRQRAAPVPLTEMDERRWERQQRSGYPEPEEEYLRAELAQRVQTVVRSLPEKYRVVVILQHYQGLSYQEISEALSLPLKTVATRVYRAKLLLKGRLAQANITGGERL